MLCNTMGAHPCATEGLVIMQYNLIKDDKLDSTIATVILAMGTSNKAIQTLLITILIHIDKHGEVSKATKLYNAMNDSDDVSAADTTRCKDFLVEFGKVSWDKDAKSYTYDKGKKTKLNGKDEAKATMWWNMNKKAVSKGFDYLEEIAKLNKKARKQVAKAVELLGEGKPEEAGAITVNQKALQAIALINSGTVNPDVVLKAAGFHFESDNLKQAS